MNNSVEKLISAVHANLEHWNTPQVYKECLGLIDLTSLKPNDTISSISKMVEKVNSFKSRFPDYNTPASICVFPNFSKCVKETLTAPGVGITVVSGTFPASQSYLEVKLLESEMAVKNGATEVDIVLALNKFLDDNKEGASNEIRAIKEVIGDTHLKVILETGILTTEERIRDASFLAMEAGADFIKTSTGKLEPSATPFAACVMCQCIKEYYEKTGRKVGFKPAGGISTAKDALVYYAITETILGKEWLNPSLLRFGASRVTNSILSELEKSTISYY